MALSDVATAQLWETFRAGGGAELVRDAVRLVLQELIEAEAAEAVGAGRYERTQTRTNERSGRRARLLAAQAGDVELRILKLRRGSFMPSVIEPRRRIDRALHAVVMEACVAGVSARSVDDLVAALGAESGISKSEVSRICAGLDETVEAFRGRRLDHIEFPCVCLDATYLKVRNSVGQPTSTATVVATGIAADGNREVLGCDLGDSESEAFWDQFLGSLRDRGLTGVRLVIADAHRGLRAAADRWFCGAARQRCRVHFVRNLLAVVPRTHQQMAAALLGTIFAQPDAHAAADAWDRVAAQLADAFPKAGPLTADAKSDVLALAAFPKAHWQKIRTRQPPRTRQQRDQTTITSRGDLPQQSVRHPPRRRHSGRPPRRMAGHPAALPLTRLHEPTPPRTRYRHTSRNQTGNQHRGSTPKPTTPRDKAVRRGETGKAARTNEAPTPGLRPSRRRTTCIPFRPFPLVCPVAAVAQVSYVAVNDSATNMMTSGTSSHP